MTRDPIVVVQAALQGSVALRRDLEATARDVVACLRQEGYDLPPQPTKPAKGCVAAEEDWPEWTKRIARRLWPSNPHPGIRQRQ